MERFLAARFWRALVLCAVAAAGCGFSPALAPDGSAAGLRGDVEINAPASRAGFEITRRLEERLGLPSSPSYLLRLRIVAGAQVTGIPADRVTARVNLLAEVNYDVVEIASNRVVRRGSVQSFTGYSSTSTTAATAAAREDAEARLMAILADRIVADLLATAETWRT